MWSRRLRFPRKLGSLSGKSCLGILWIGLLGRGLRLSAHFCCILCRKAEEDLDHLFWDCHYVRAAMWSSFLPEFGICFAGSRSVKETIEELLLHLPFKDKEGFLRVWDIWGQRNEQVFRGTGRERKHSEIWFLARFHVSL